MANNKPLDLAKANRNRCERALNDALLRLIGSAITGTPEWVGLYYSPSPKNAAAFTARFPGLAEAECAAWVASHAEVVRLRAEKPTKAMRAVEADSGRYAYSTTPTGPARPLVAGEYFLVTYGPAGTQLCRVVSQTARRMAIRRLFNRGTRYAVWRESSMPVGDARILGPSAPCSQDPACPA